MHLDPITQEHQYITKKQAIEMARLAFKDEQDETTLETVIAAINTHNDLVFDMSDSQTAMVKNGAFINKRAALLFICEPLDATGRSNVAANITTKIDELAPAENIQPINSQTLSLVQVVPRYGRWVSVQDFLAHEYYKTGVMLEIEPLFETETRLQTYCDQCWKPQTKQSKFCPECGANMTWNT